MAAFSLAEAIVWGTVFLLVMASLYLVLVAALRQFQQGTAFVDAQQESVKGMRRMVADLSNSTADGLTVAPQHCWFLSPERPKPATGYDYDPTTKRLRWWKWVAWYQAGNELVRSEVALPGAPLVVIDPAPTPAPDLSLFQAATFPARETGARHVERFDVSAEGGAVRLTLVCALAVDSRRATRVTLTNLVAVRNRR